MDDRRILGNDDLSALVGSRLCHDLINPLGAIGNGVELLGMAPGKSGPEIALIEDAVRDAQSRIRFFRIAFGKAGADGRTSPREIAEILDGLYPSGGRLSVSWTPDADLARQDAKFGLLMLACAETAMPLGGQVDISESNGQFHLQGSGKRVSIDPDLWAILGGSAPGRGLIPAEVQFLLLAKEAIRQDRVIRHKASDGFLEITA